MESKKEPRNIFDILLLISGLLFIVTTLAVAFVPILEEKARDSGNPPPPSPFRDSLREDGIYWILFELAALIFFGMASMTLDYLRRLQKERTSEKIPTSEESHPSS